MKLRAFASAATIGFTGALGLPASAQQSAPAPAPAPAPAAAPSTAIDLGNGISMTGHIELGANVNTDSPDNNINFGQTFTDQSNTIRMNQLLLNVERDLDPKNAGYQWGFKFTGMYGTDARVTHFMNEFDRSTNGPYQFDIVELDAQAHVPTFGGGTDVKLGQYPTPLGAEVIDATGNTFYSHSYIFNYGLPRKHTGLLTITHVNDMLDVWLGIDTGVNDSIGDEGDGQQLGPENPGRRRAQQPARRQPDDPGADASRAREPALCGGHQLHHQPTGRRTHRLHSGREQGLPRVFRHRHDLQDQRRALHRQRAQLCARRSRQGERRRHRAISDLRAQ